MKTLIVNCSLKSTANEALLYAVGKFSEFTVKQFRDIPKGYRLSGDIDAVVLSGSAARIVNSSDRELYLGTIDLIKSCNVPILGICFGHQLLCHTLGAEVGSLRQPVLGRFEQVNIVEANGIFAGLPQRVPLAESHHDYVLKGSLDAAGLVLLADSSSCEVEAVRHKSKPLFGVQFHPERTTVKNQLHPEGHIIIRNFYLNDVRTAKR